MSWKPEVNVENRWQHNALVFASQAEAAEYASDLYSRWTLTTGHRAVESDQPATHSYIDGKLHLVIHVNGMVL